MHTTKLPIQLQEALEKHISTLKGTYCWEFIQKEAFNLFYKIGLPSSKTEAYKNTPIAKALSEKFNLGHLSSDIDSKLTETDLSPFLQQQFDSYSVMLINGEISNITLSQNTKPLPFQVCSFQEAYKRHQELFIQYFSRHKIDKLDIFRLLNTAIFTKGVFIYIPDNIILDKPLCLYHITDSTVQQTTVHPRVLIAIGKNSQLSLINNWHNSGNQEAFINSVVDIIVGSYAQLDHYTLQTQVGKTYMVNNIHCYQTEYSSVNNYIFSWDGVLIRNNLHISIQKSHAQTNMYGLYYLCKNQHVDNHTLVDHKQPFTTSNELYKGIITENATGIFNGKIYVQAEAQKTNAFQTNNNILLSDTATIHTKPQLEIWADDVKCSHGATVGTLNEAQLFYLQSRGISEKVARRMLLYAFADEVISKVPLSPLREYVQTSLTEKLSNLI